MLFDTDLSGQYRVEAHRLGDKLEIVANVQSANPGVKTLRLVTTSLAGYELLKRLKSDPLTRDIPVIILTH